MQSMWFQHDEAPANFSNIVRGLDVEYRDRWKGRGSHVPRHPPLDFFLWGQMKNVSMQLP